jgi:hypothetical protein
LPQNQGKSTRKSRILSLSKNTWISGLHLHPDPVTAKILSKRKINFTEKLKLYFKLGVLNFAVSWSGLMACISRLWWKSGIGKPSPPDPDSPLDAEVMISSGLSSLDSCPSVRPLVLGRPLTLA